MFKTKYLAAAFGAAMILCAAVPVSAASLTPSQISAITSLLQAFGADQSVINNVTQALGGSSTPSSCSSFSDLKYGDFDTDPGGRVSQLQTFLGISSTTFGFGTYGPKTQVAWNIKCGSNPQPSVSFSATPMSGAAPLMVTFSLPETEETYGSILNFGDGSATVSPSWTCTGGPCRIGSWTDDHTYAVAGTYSVYLTKAGATLGTATITVTGNNSTQPSATIDQSSLIATSTATLTGSVSGTSSLCIEIGKGQVSLPNMESGPGTIPGYVWGVCSSTGAISIANGRWSINGYNWDFPNGVYTIGVYDGVTGDLLKDPSGNTLGTATITVTGGSTTPPSATIDTSSLTTMSGAPIIISGTATANVPDINVYVSGNGQEGGTPGGTVPVTQGQWTSPINGTLSPGTYTVSVYTNFNNPAGGLALLTTGTLTVR